MSVSTLNTRLETISLTRHGCALPDLSEYWTQSAKISSRFTGSRGMVRIAGLHFLYNYDITTPEIAGNSDSDANENSFHAR